MTEERTDYAIWQGDDGMHMCGLSNPLMERSIEEGMKLIKIVRNKTHNEAAQIYYDTFGMGTYKPMDI